MMRRFGRTIGRRGFLTLSGGVAAGALTTPLLGGSAAAVPLTGASTLYQSDSWANAQVVFDDPANSLTSAGWTVRPPEPGAYVTDSTASQGNPHQLPLRTAEPGTYLLYADEVSEAPYSYVQMSRPLSVGSGAWRVDLRAKIDDIPVVNEYQYIRGLVLTVTVNKYKHSYTLVDRTKFMAATGGGGAGYVRTLAVPFDGNYHNWSIIFDGVDTSFLLIDDVVVSRFRNVNLATTTAADSVSIMASALQWKSGRLEIHMDSMRVRRLDTAPALGNGTNMVSAGWQVDPAQVGAYITDSVHSSGTVTGMKNVVAGDYLAYSAAGAAVAMTARKPVVLGSGSWALRFFAKFIALSSGGANGSRGIQLRVTAGGRRYLLAFGGGNVYLLNAESGQVIQSVAGVAPNAATFVRWQFGADTTGRFFLERNGSKIMVVDAGASSATGEADGLQISVDARSPATGATEVYLNKLELARDVQTLWFEPRVAMSVLPTSGDQINAVLALADADPHELASGALTADIVVTAESGAQAGNEIASASVAPSQAATAVSLDPGGYQGEITISTTLRRGAEILVQTPTRHRLVGSVVEVAAGAHVVSQPGVARLFKHVDECTGPNGIDVLGAGWTLGAYEYDGTQVGGIFLDSTASSQPLTVPIDIRGWTAIYVGFISGCEQFEFGVGGETATVQIPGAPKFTEGQAFGHRGAGEVLAWTGNLSGLPVSLAPTAGKKARIAYVRAVGLNSSEATLVQTPDEQDNKKRVMYNNDGYSDFYTGKYTTPAQLKARAIDIYANSDVEALCWQAGTTMFFSYTSQFAGVPYASLTAADEALMRAGDKKAMQDILGYVQRNEIPAEILAARGDEIGVKTYASLRMNTFYSSGAPWLNGNLFAEYKQYLAKKYDGSDYFEMSFAYEPFSTYVANVLVEQAGFAAIDGIDMDFCRYPYAVGWEPYVLAAYTAQYGSDARKEVTPQESNRWKQFRAEVTTQFMRQVRTRLPNTKLIARVPQATALAYGLDVATWVAEELIDVLVVTNVSTEQFWTNLDEYKTLVAGTNIKLYGGTSGSLGGTDPSKADEDAVGRGFPTATGHTLMTAEMYQERANQFYRAGYDGIYVFNHWSGAASLGLLGDRVRNEKWRVFSLPALWVRDAVEVSPVQQSSMEDLVGLLAEFKDSGEVRHADGPRLDAQLDYAQLMLDRQSKDRAVQGVRRFIDAVHDVEQAGRCHSGVASRLVVAARQVINSW